MFERRDSSRGAWVRSGSKAVAGAAASAVLLLHLSAGSALAQSPAPGNPFYIQMLPLVLVIIIFYFLILRPQQKRQKTLQKMIEGLKKGDRVLTAGGLYGIVFAMKEDTVILEVGRDVRAEFAKSAITAVVPAE
ncbi:MAG: preprotein translocase subunit YajC [Candidatus Eisenbacteria bacterium]